MSQLLSLIIKSVQFSGHEDQSPAWRPSHLSYWTYKVIASLLFIPLANEKAPVFFSPPITHLAASPFLLHFIPNQYYLTTYRSAMMAVISAAWKLQKKLLFVLKLRATEINSTFENWYWSLCVCVCMCVCVFACLCTRRILGVKSSFSYIISVPFWQSQWNKPKNYTHMNLFEAIERRTILTSHNWISPLTTVTATVFVIIFQGLDVGLLFSRFALGFVLFI